MKQNAMPVGCDSSVLIPALAGHHEFHAHCLPHLRRVNTMPAHVLLETYTRLTGQRGANAVPPRVVATTLQALNLPIVQLPPGKYLETIDLMARAGRQGGAVYDAQIAATAKHHGLKLFTRDRRAVATYDLIGVDYELI